jgi:hypothetical protein
LLREEPKKFHSEVNGINGFSAHRRFPNRATGDPSYQGGSVTKKMKMAGLVLLALNVTACSRFFPPQKVADSKPAAPAEAPAALPAAATPASVTPPPSAHGVKTEMRNVMFHLTDDAAAHVESLSGEMWPTGKNEMPVFDDKTSFEVHVINARISITPEAMASILNSQVFAGSDSPLKDISISIDKDRLEIKGRLRGKREIPFETSAVLTATADGRVRITTEKLKALHVPVKGMMDKLGIELASLISTSSIPGIVTDKNDVLMDLGVVLPAPHIKGKVSAVLIGENSIVTIFGDEAKPGSANDPVSYMRFQGNPVRLGKLTMENTDLTVLNLDSDDPIDWNQDHYREQLVAGYSKITPKFGLRAYARDFAKLKHRQAIPVQAKN